MTCRSRRRRQSRLHAHLASRRRSKSLKDRSVLVMPTMKWHKPKCLFSFICVLLSIGGGGCLVQAASDLSPQTTTSCSISDEQQSRDPALKELTFDLGQGPQSILAYVTPDVTTFYPPGIPPPAKTAVKPKFKGLSAKFINMSNQRVRLYWYERG